MRIAIFHTEFAYSGGAERIIFEEYKYFRSQGFGPEIFTASADYKSCYPAEIKNYRINSFTPGFLGKIFPHEFLILLSFLFLPFWVKKLSSFDFYLAENQAGPWWAYVVSKFTGKPFGIYQNYPTTVVYPRKIDRGAKRNVWYVDLIIKIIKPLMIRVDKKVMRSAKIRFGCGEYVTKICQKAYGVKFINCPGGTVLGKFNSTIFSERFKKPYLLIMNRHFPAKEFEWGIKAVSVLKEKYEVENLRLIITGSFTKYTQELIKLTKSLGISRKVEFTDLVQGRKWTNLYSNALVFLYTAPEEDFGLGVIEAMAHGVPVVAWDSAGPKYIVKNGKTGFLAKLGSLSDFTDKIYKLISDRKLNFRISEYAYAESKNFTWQKHGEIILNEIKKYS